MRTLLKAESVKYFKNIKLRAILGLLFLLLLGNSMLQMLKISKENEELLLKCEERVSIATSNAQKYEKSIRELNEKTDEEQIIWLKTIQKYWRDNASFWAARKVYIEHGDWITALEVQIKQEKEILEGIQNGILQEGEIDDMTSAALDNNIRKNEILYEYKIDTRAEQISGLQFLNRLCDTNGIMVIVIVMLLCMGDIFTEEKESGSWKILWTQPFSKRKIWFAKIISTFGISFLGIIFVIIVVFFFNCIVGGVGNGHYPVEYIYIPAKADIVSMLKIPAKETVDYIPLQVALLQKGGLWILNIFFYGSVASLLAVLSKTVDETYVYISFIVFAEVLFKSFLAQKSAWYEWCPFYQKNAKEFLLKSIEEKAAVVGMLLVQGLIVYCVSLGLICRRDEG